MCESFQRFCEGHSPQRALQCPDVQIDGLSEDSQESLEHETFAGLEICPISTSLEDVGFLDWSHYTTFSLPRISRCLYSRRNSLTCEQTWRASSTGGPPGEAPRGLGTKTSGGGNSIDLDPTFSFCKRDISPMQIGKH
ncbi:hypothetical protein KCU83_g103, partial [Aureobasidium melanogenum]